MSAPTPMPDLLAAQHAAIGFKDGHSRGMVIRLAMLMTHYRKPIDWNARRLAEASSTYRRWLAAVEKNDSQEPPAEVLEALCDDLNTPLAIMAMSRMAKQKRGKELYAAMKLLGFT